MSSQFGLKAASATGQNFLNQQYTGLGNVQWFPADGSDNVPDPIETQGQDLPVTQQLTTVAYHDPWGWGLSQIRLYVLPATAQNPNTIPNTNYYEGLAGWSLRQRDMAMQQQWIMTSTWGKTNADVSPGMGSGQYWTPQYGWGQTVMNLYFIPQVEPPIITGGGTGTSGTGTAGASPTLIEIRHSIPDARIFYTTDGSDPGGATARPYTGEFLVPATHVQPVTVRAIAVVGREAASPIVSRRVFPVREREQ
jgi:hypothetical protein